MKIKILYIVPNLYASSGVTSVILNYLKKIDKEKYQIDFLVLNNVKNNVNNIILNEGSKIFYLQNKLKNIFLLRREIYNFYKDNNYEIVELHAPNLSFLFLKAAKKANIKARIVHTHSSIRSLNKIKNIIWKLLNLKMKKYANIYFACSKQSGLYWFGEKICSQNNFKIILNGTDIDKYKNDGNIKESLRKKYNIKNELIIGYVGRISKDKNLDFLIEVYKKILNTDKQTKLFIVGDGQELRKIKKKSRKFKENIIFTGYKKNVVDYYNLFDILVLPSKREGLPMTIVEAQLCNLRCYLSDTITKEVDIGNAFFLPLKKKLWVKKILESKVNKKEKIDREKFNINNNVKELQLYYDYIDNGDD